MARRYRFKRWILDYRLLGVALLVASAIGASYVMPVSQSHTSLASGYPSVVCPANLGDGSTTTYLSSQSLAHTLIKPVSAVRAAIKSSKPIKVKKVTSVKKAVTAGKKVAAVKKKVATTHKKVATSANVKRAAPSKNVAATVGASYPMLVAGSAASDWSFNQSSGGLGAAICTSGSPDAWFVGGSAQVTSQDTLELVNAGAGSATVIATAYGAHSQSTPLNIAIKPGFDQRVSLDALMPGESSVVTHLEIKSGRVATFLYGVHKKGLSSLGSDLIAPQPAPAMHLVIPAVLNANGKNSYQTLLRLLAPGAVATKVHVTALSGDGSFVPMNFDQITLSPGMVTDQSFTNLTSSTPMAFVIDADQPIVAAALTTTANEFAWSSAVSGISHFAANFQGTAPTIVLSSGRVGGQIRALVDYQGAKGSGQQTVSATEIAILNLGTLHSLDLNNLLDVNKEPLFAGAIFKSGSGYTYLPLFPGASLETSTNPVANLAALSRTSN